MCEPLTIATASAAVIGAGISAYSQVQAGKAQNEIAQNNATVAGWNRSDAIQRGQMAVDSVRREARAINANATAAVGANNIETTTGSSANMFAVSMAQAERDAEIARGNAARSAWGFQNEEQDLIAQGAIAKKTSYLGALGTGVGALGQVGSIYANRPRAK